MTAPSKPISPKEALERISTILHNGIAPEWIKLSGSIPSSVYDEIEIIIKVAIPIAELHQQMVEMLEDCPIVSHKKILWWEKMTNLLTKLEALK